MTDNERDITTYDDEAVDAGPGRLLRQARESVGIDIGELAARLHLRTDVIEALEAERFDRLPEPAYVRGYLRGCARELGVDDGPLIEAYRSLNPSDPTLEPPMRLQQPFREEGGNRTVVYMVAALLVVVIVGLFGYRLFSDWSGGEEIGVATADGVVEETAEPFDPIGDGSAAIAPDPAAGYLPELPPAFPVADGVLPSVDVDMVTDDPVTESRLPVAGAEGDGAPAVGMEVEVSAADTESAEQEVAEPRTDELSGAELEAEPTGDDVVRFSLHASSWVEVWDGDGTRIMTDLLQGGTEREVWGDAPLRIVIGNIDGVRIEFNGEEVDLTPFFGTGRVARFTLPME